MTQVVNFTLSRATPQRVFISRTALAAGSVEPQEPVASAIRLIEVGHKVRGIGR
jgi:hypothetical protein